MKNTLKRIQEEVNLIRLTGYNCDLDDWLMDHIDNIQHALNDFYNAEFKDSEPDPFN